VLPRSLQSTRSTPTLPGHEGRLRVPPRSRRCGGETSNHLLFRIVVAPQLEADRALCRRSAVVSGDCCARPTVTGAGRQYGAVVTACCRTLRGSVSQNRSTICFTASSLHRRSKPTMLYDVVRPSSIVDWRMRAGVRAYCRLRIGPVTERARACGRPHADHRLPTCTERPAAGELSLRVGGTAPGRPPPTRAGRGWRWTAAQPNVSRARPSARQAGACTAHNAIMCLQCL
jgi:hypothetical protein